MERLSQHVWRLGPYTLPSFLVRGEGEALVFEVGVRATAPRVLAELGELGVAPEEVTRVVVSHGHSDHAAGQTGLLAGLPRARLCLHPGTARYLAKETTAAAFLPEEVFTGRAVSDLSEDQWPAMEPLTRDDVEQVSPGGGLRVGGVEVQWLSADGHVPGGVAAWLPGEGVMLASDSAGYAVPAAGPWMPMHFVAWEAYLDTLDAIEQKLPAVLALGHQMVYRGPEVAPYFRDLRADMERFHQSVLRDLKAGRDPQAMADELFQHYYRHELTIFEPQTMRDAFALLIRRSAEAEPRAAAGEGGESAIG